MFSVQSRIISSRTWHVFAYLHEPLSLLGGGEPDQSVLASLRALLGLVGDQVSALDQVALEGQAAPRAVRALQAGELARKRLLFLNLKFKFKCLKFKSVCESVLLHYFFRIVVFLAARPRKLEAQDGGDEEEEGGELKSSHGWCCFLFIPGWTHSYWKSLKNLPQFRSAYLSLTTDC